MTLLKLVLPVLAAGVLAAACGGGNERSQRTGVPQIDEVIELVLTRDRDGLRDLLQFTSLPCTDASGAGGPRCLEEPAGTSVEVFEANQCEPLWLRRNAVEPLLDEVAGVQPSVYAAFLPPEGFYLQGRYAIVFEGDDQRASEAGLKRYTAIGVEGDNGLITGIALGCGAGEPVHFLLPHADAGFDNYLIEPPE